MVCIAQNRRIISVYQFICFQYRVSINLDEVKRISGRVIYANFIERLVSLDLEYPISSFDAPKPTAKVLQMSFDKDMPKNKNKV